MSERQFRLWLSNWPLELFEDAGEPEDEPLSPTERWYRLIMRLREQSSEGKD